MAKKVYVGTGVFKAMFRIDPRAVESLPSGETRFLQWSHGFCCRLNLAFAHLPDKLELGRNYEFG